MPIFHPQEKGGANSEANPFIAFLTGSFGLFGNPILSYNLAMLTTGLLVALSFYGACYFVTRHTWASVVGALVASANNAQLWRLWGHINIAAPIFIPWIYLFYLSHQRTARPLFAILCGASVVLQATCSFYLTAISLLGLGILFLYDLISNPKRFFTPAKLLPFGLSLLIAIGITFLLATPYREAASRLGVTRGLHEATLYSADLFTYLFPTSFEGGPRTLLGGWLTQRIAWEPRIENVAFLGYLALLLALLGWRRWLSSRRLLHNKMQAELPNPNLSPADWMIILPPRLAVLAIAGLLLSFGPYLRLGPWLSPIEGPFHLLFQWVPPVRFIRATSRFCVLVTIAISLMVALQLTHSRWFNNRSTFSHTLWVALLLAMIGDYRPAYPPARVTPSAELRDFLQVESERRFAVLPLSDIRFFPQMAQKFYPTPVGFPNAANKYYFDQLVAFAQSNPGPILTVLGMDGAIVYDENQKQKLRQNSDFTLLVEWDSGIAAFSLADISEERQTEATEQLATITEKPLLPNSETFPDHIPATSQWTPANWQRLDHGNPPAWHAYPWERMSDPGFRYMHLTQSFYDALLPPRPAGKLARVYVKMQLDDPGVDYTQAQLTWLAEGDSGWQTTRGVKAWIRTDGEPQVVCFDLRDSAQYDAATTATALQFEFTLTPHPGQLVQVYEIRFEPEGNI
jgi:uncharacterized membrane protein